MYTEQLRCYAYHHGIINMITINIATYTLKCAYHTNGVLYDTVGVLITLLYGD